jgi:hypothetical protein
MTGKHAILSVVAASVLLAAPASAQGSSGFSLGVGSGFAQASQGVGSTLLSTLEFPSPFSMVRPRVDAFYSNWGRWPNVAGFTGNLLLTPFSSARVAPYLLAGAGAYIEEDSNPKAGATFGFGLRLPGQFRSVVIESQAHVYRLAQPRVGDRDAPPGAIDDRGLRRNRIIWKPIGITIQF